MSQWSKEEIEDLRLEISKKAATDAEFRKAILGNPKQEIEKLAGKKIPEEFSLDVIENKPGVVKTFVLPNFISESLSKEEMLAIAGGRSSTSTQNVQTTVNVTTEATVEETTTTTTAEVGGEVVVAGVVVLV